MAICQINVKFLTLTFLSLFYSFLFSCSAQTSKKSFRTNTISIQSISSGNTGFRGRVMPEDVGKSNSGVEYLEFEMKAKTQCTIDSVCVVFPDTQLRVLLPNEAFPKLLKKNETWFCRSENVSAFYETKNGETKQHAALTLEIYLKGKKEVSTHSHISRVLPK